MNYTSLPEAEGSPDAAVGSFQRQIIYHIHLWTLAVLVPLMVLQWRQGNVGLALLLSLFAINLALVVAFLKWRRLYLFQGRTYTLFAMASTIYSTVLNDYIGLFWAYPAIAAGFFLMRPRESIPLGLAFLVIMLVVSFQVFPQEHFWRITGSLTMTLVFALVFAQLVDRLQRELTRIATTDPLTGCLNRTQLVNRLNEQIQLHERYGRDASLILLDLDFFKRINDRFGHGKGDEVLVEVAGRLKQRLRQSDLLFRIGGEEFLALLPETTEAQALQVAMDLTGTLRDSPFPLGMRVTASAGVSEISPGETWSRWLRRADQALYAAKEQGRDRVVVAPPPEPQ